MRQAITRVSRHLARLINQQAARTNAADGCVELRERRMAQEDVDGYLQRRFGGRSQVTTGKGAPSGPQAPEL